MLSRAAASLRAATAGGAAPLLRPATAFSPLSTAAAAKRGSKKPAANPDPTPPPAAAPDPVVSAPPKADPAPKVTVQPARDPSTVRRPSVMPYQRGVANTVHLVGKIGMPVLPETKEDGELMAVSVLMHDKTGDTPQFWIPVVFQGDLAHIASSHLKQDDLVYVTGQLTGDMPEIENLDARTNTQVFADSFCFVENDITKKHIIAAKQEAASDHSAHAANISPTRQAWDDLLSNPRMWWDNRNSIDHSSAAFKHKETGKILWINEHTPNDVLSRLDSLFPDKSTPKKSETSGNVKNEILWKDLSANPGDWKDYRVSKQNGSVKPKYPDFIHKASREPLWLSSAPSWALSQLNDLKFNESNDSDNVNEGRMTAAPTGKKEGNVKNEMSWKDLSANPGNWKDNRISKKNGLVKPKFPDFSHKASGEALWLDSAPSWFLSQLHDLELNESNESYNVNVGMTAAPIRKKEEDLWKNVVENPTKWWDNRVNKRNARAPDFKHKESGEALWLSSCPAWALPNLLSPNKGEEESRQSWKNATAS